MSNPWVTGLLSGLLVFTMVWTPASDAPAVSDETPPAPPQP